MQSFLQFVAEEQLQEKLIVVGNGANYGQVIFMAGGMASGKGFVSSHFIEGHKFKIIDPDHLKSVFLSSKNLLTKHPELGDIDLRNPEDATRLHDFIKGKGWEETIAANLLNRDPKKKDTLPNIIFDAAFKNLKRYEEYTPMLKAAGYDSKNIHLIWVLTDYQIAVKNNRKRSRVAPDDLHLESHEGAAATLYKIANGEVPHDINGGIYVVLNNPENTVFFSVDGKKVDGKQSRYSPVLGGNTPQIAVEDFKYIQIKKPGQPPIGDKELMRQIYLWVYNSIPATDKTANIFNDIKSKIGSNPT